MKISSTKKILPNIFTSANIFFGFASVIYSSKGEYIIACWLIVAAALADALDGAVARLTKTTSKFGVELDSLADVISFGFAPSFLVYGLLLNIFGIWGMILSSFLLIGGAYRLARFNIQLVGFDKSYFSGLPIPTQAITIASFVILYSKEGKIIQPFVQFLIPLVVILSLLMVSTIKYDTLPKFNLAGIKKKKYLFTYLLVSLITVILTEGKALFYVFIIYIVFGIFRQVFNLITKSDKPKN